MRKNNTQNNTNKKNDDLIDNIEVGSLLLAFISFFVFYFFLRNRFLLSFTVLMGIIYFAFGFYESEKQGVVTNHFIFFFRIESFDYKKGSFMFLISQLFGIIIILTLFYYFISLLINESAMKQFGF